MDIKTTERLVHAFVTSRIDSNNSMLFGLPQCELAKIQRVQNTAARLVLCVPRREHITPFLRKLHWLPIECRALYKMLLLTYKALNDMAPVFISDLVNRYVPTRSLRSSSKNLLEVLRPSTKFYGARSYVVAAATEWNCLPSEVRHAETVSIFKSRLKTHLFGNYYNHGLTG